MDLLDRSMVSDGSGAEGTTTMSLEDSRLFLFVEVIVGTTHLVFPDSSMVCGDSAGSRHRYHILIGQNDSMRR